MASAAALVFAGKSVATPAISFLVTKAINYLYEYFKADGYDEIQRRLEQALPKIQAVFQVTNPERIKEQSSALDKWLWQLRDAYEEAEDAIDEVEYYKLKEKAEDNKVSDWGSSFAKMKHRAIKSVMSASVLDKNIKGFTRRGTFKRLQKAVEGLDKAASGVESFLALAGLLRGGTTSHQEEDSLNKDRETGSMITAPKVFGRQKDLEQVIGFLTKPSVGDAEIVDSCNVSVVSIVGHGGMGKTTLAQLVHKDDTISNHFEKVIWACVSTSFNAKDILSKILENAGWQTADASTLESSQRILGEKLSSVKFLIILDDVWEDKKTDQWEKLLAPLREGKNGSKILLTTRIKRVAEMAENVMRGENKLYELGGLEVSDNIELFRHHAFPCTGLQDDAAFNQIGEQIAKNLRGCPLVTKVVAAHLRDNMRLDYWNEFLTQSLQHFCGSSKDIMNVLKLSYYQLSPELQTCFRFCSLFPQDYRFDKDKLVGMWVDSGLISQDESETALMSIGEEYLVQLTRKSFFDSGPGEADKESGYYVMHDLMHDLATNVSFGECLQIADVTNLEHVESTVRHICLEKNIYNLPVDKFKKICSLEHVRTIIIQNWGNDEEENIDIVNAVEQLVERSRSLRLLQTDLRHTSDFACKVGKLKHLRCIILQQQEACITQESMSGLFKLYQLTRLQWPCAEIGSKQVRDGGYLDHLRYVPYGPGTYSMIPIGRLTSLKFLNYEIRRVKGYTISVLKDLKTLRSLSVVDLQNVDSQEEAKEANMKSKKYLESLQLRWSRGNSRAQISDDELIIDTLEPHANLKNLCISGFDGSRIPHWIAAPSLKLLVKLEFNDCKHIEELPNLEKLLTLKYLKLSGLTRLRRIGQLLTTLEDGCMELFLPPSLRKLEVESCLKLEELPYLPPTLVLLRIEDVGLTRLPRIAELQNGDDEIVSSQLKEIYVRGCQSLNSLEGSLFEQKQFMGALCELRIKDCVHLESALLPFEEMNGLRELSIQECPKLRTQRGAGDKLPQLSLERLRMGPCGDLELLLLQSLQVFTNLYRLTLDNCSVVESLPPADVFESLMSLRFIGMSGCGNLSSLGGLRSLACLVDLTVVNCPKLIEAGLSLALDVSGFHEEPRRLVQIKSIDIDHPSLLLVEPLKSLFRTNTLYIRSGSEMLDVIEQWLLQNCTSLQRLSIRNANLESLLPSIRELSSLQRLYLYGSNQLRSLSNLPPSLQSLYIEECHPELRKKATEHGSLEWNKISQIPSVEIGDCSLQYGRKPAHGSRNLTAEVMNHTKKTRLWSRALCCPGSQAPTRSFGPTI